jgi:hypothetical protein
MTIHIILGFAIYFGIMSFWGIFFDIYTKEIEPNNRVASNVAWFSIFITLYIHFIS